MARIAYSEIDALPDLLDAIAFEILFGAIPGSGNSRHLTLKCTTVNLSGFSNEAFQQTLHGHQINFRGGKRYPQVLSATFVEDSTFATQRALREWHERIVGSESGNSQGYKADYSVTAQLVVYDTTGAVTDRSNLESCFIQDVPDVSFTGDASAAVQVPAVFKFDRLVPTNLALL